MFRSEDLRGRKSLEDQCVGGREGENNIKINLYYDGGLYSYASD
jgi:hypothetical protein